MVNPHDLIDIAARLADGLGEENRGRPKQTELRRAVSCAYYAMFHALASCCADTMIGATPSRRSNQAWRQVYRALEHGRSKQQCSNMRMMRLFPTAIQNFGEHFILMQRLRQSADYDPLVEFHRSQIKQLVEETGDTIRQFESVDTTDRRAFSAYVLFTVRRS